MQLVRRRTQMPTFTPFSEFDEMPEMVRRFLRDPFTGFAAAPTEWIPAVEVAENADEITISAELPGMNEQDVMVNVENDILSIRGEKKDERRETGNGKKFHVVERFYGNFERSFTLPRSVDPEKIRAEFDKGVLTIHMPKTALAKGRQIAINAG